jgi:hypothetical protein
MLINVDIGDMSGRASARHVAYIHMSYSAAAKIRTSEPTP